MSIEICDKTEQDTRAQEKPKIRVFAFIDGFNLYHALDKLERPINAADASRYHKYKWLCLKTLASCFVRQEIEELAGVEWFTAYPNWPGSQDKRSRHERYVGALRSRGVIVTFGEFKNRDTECRFCDKIFKAPVEKQTDINIAISMLERASQYDKAILLTGDSDQVAVVKMLKKMHPEKIIAALAPIGRSARDLAKVCDLTLNMTEQNLKDSQLPNPLPVVVNGKQTNSSFVKPSTWA